MGGKSLLSQGFSSPFSWVVSVRSRSQWGLGAPVQAGLQAEDEDDDIEEAMNSGYVSIMTIFKNWKFFGFVGF